MKTICTLLTLSLLIVGSVSAGPLTEAKVTKIINDVSVVDSSRTARKAELQDIIKGETGLKSLKTGLLSSLNRNANISTALVTSNSVTISNGKTVHVQGNGPARVFTNNPHPTGSGGNSATTGMFIGQGATTKPLSAGPGPGG